MIDLYLKSIGLNNPTIVEYNNNGRKERLESRRLDSHDLVEFWKMGFDLHPQFGEKIILHCSSKNYNAMSQRTAVASYSVVELLAQRGVKCVVDDEWFEEIPFDKMDKAELTYRVKQETAEDILTSLLDKLHEVTGCGTPYQVKKIIKEIAEKYDIEMETGKYDT